MLSFVLLRISQECTNPITQSNQPAFLEINMIYAPSSFRPEVLAKKTNVSNFTARPNLAAFNELTLNARWHLKACQTQNCRDYYMLWLLPNSAKMFIFHLPLLPLPSAGPAPSYTIVPPLHRLSGQFWETLGGSSDAEQLPYSCGKCSCQNSSLGFYFPAYFAPLVVSVPSFLDFFIPQNPVTGFNRVKVWNRWTVAV